MSTKPIAKLDSNSGAYDLFISLVAVLSITLITWYFVLDSESEIAQLIDYFDYGICVIFFGDFLRNLIKANHKGRYMYTWGILDLAASIPAIAALRFVRFARLIRVIRAIKSVHVLVISIKRDRRSALLVGVLTLTLFGLIGSCFGALYFESQDPNGNITNAADALWWSVTTISSVGYGDLYPVTTGGRFCAAVLMVLGIGLFATLAGIVADLLRSLSSSN
jgi:voltage-gated potassium channel